jgi:copper resistance protein B
MKSLQTMLILTALICSQITHADMAMNDNPIITRAYIQTFEYRIGQGEDALHWEDATLRIGTDLNRIVATSNGDANDGKIDTADFSIQYSRSVSTYWDARFGWQRDIRPKPKRDWFIAGFTGIAPYFFDTEIYLGIGRSGSVKLHAESEIEMLITQRWMLAPAVSADFYSDDDPEVGIGSGLSETELGLRLRYVARKNFLPYFGINWVQEYGSTAKLSKANGNQSHQTQWVIGIKAWY